MKVLLRDIPCHRHIELPVELIDRAVGDLPLRVALGDSGASPAGAGVADLDLYEEGDNVFLRGSLRGWVELACSRCVEPVKLAVDEPLTVSFLPQSELPPDDDVSDVDELAAEDLDLYGYEGEEIDLGPLLHERLVMALPYAPLCRPDCRGLCSQCGVNLNSEQCACQPVPDPRLAALKDFKV